MPVAITEPPAQTTPLEPRRKRWTRAEYDALDATGLFDQQHLELIEGELIDKMGKNWPHVLVLKLVRIWLDGVFGIPFVNSESTIDVSPADNPTSRPEPDILVCNKNTEQFLSAIPKPRDVKLVVEVSDTSLVFDLTTKAGLYARAEIPEYWVADVNGRRLIVHREPGGGKYRLVRAYSELETVAPLAAPQSEFRVADAFPAPPQE